MMKGSYPHPLSSEEEKECIEGLMKKDINASDIVNTILSVDKKTLSDVKIFDLYIGDKVKEDEKSLAIKLVFTSYETLTDELVNSKVNKILKELEKKYQAVLRA